jgi:hypothetical protein
MATVTTHEPGLFPTRVYDQRFRPAAIESRVFHEAATGPRSSLSTALRELFRTLRPDDDWPSVVRGLLEGGDHAEVIALCTDVLADDPSQALAYFLRGATEGELDNYGRSLADFTRAISLDLRYARWTEALAGR